MVRAKQSQRRRESIEQRNAAAAAAAAAAMQSAVGASHHHDGDDDLEDEEERLVAGGPTIGVVGILRPDPSTLTDSSDEENINHGIFKVEKILDRKIYPSGRKEYYLKWVGFNASENSWEPEENLNCYDLIEAFNRKKDEQERIQDADFVPNGNTTTTTVVRKALKRQRSTSAVSHRSGGSSSSSPGPSNRVANNKSAKQSKKPPRKISKNGTTKKTEVDDESTLDEDDPSDEDYVDANEDVDTEGTEEMTEEEAVSEEPIPVKAFEPKVILTEEETLDLGDSVDADVQRAIQSALVVADEELDWGNGDDDNTAAASKKSVTKEIVADEELDWGDGDDDNTAKKNGAADDENDIEETPVEKEPTIPFEEKPLMKKIISSGADLVPLGKAIAAPRVPRLNHLVHRPSTPTLPSPAIGANRTPKPKPSATPVASSISLPGRSNSRPCRPPTSGKKKPDQTTAPVRKASPQKPEPPKPKPLTTTVTPASPVKSITTPPVKQNKDLPKKQVVKTPETKPMSQLRTAAFKVTQPLKGKPLEVPAEPRPKLEIPKTPAVAAGNRVQTRRSADTATPAATDKKTEVPSKDSKDKTPAAKKTSDAKKPEPEPEYRPVYKKFERPKPPPTGELQKSPTRVLTRPSLPHIRSAVKPTATTATSKPAEVINLDDDDVESQEEKLVDGMVNFSLKIRSRAEQEEGEESESLDYKIVAVSRLDSNELVVRLDVPNESDTGGGDAKTWSRICVPAKELMRAGPPLSTDLFNFLLANRFALIKDLKPATVPQDDEPVAEVAAIMDIDGHIALSPSEGNNKPIDS